MAVCGAMIALGLIREVLLSLGFPTVTDLIVEIVTTRAASGRPLQPIEQHFGTVSVQRLLEIDDFRVCRKFRGLSAREIYDFANNKLGLILPEFWRGTSPKANISKYLYFALRHLELPRDFDMVAASAVGCDLFDL